MIWKTKSRSCRQEEERRGSCASQSNGCFDPAMVEQVFACGAVIQAMREEFNRRFKAQAALEQMAGGEEREDWEGDWDDEEAASGWYEGATLGSAVQDANAGSFGGGNPSTPRNGLHARDSSRSLRGQRNKTQEDGHL